MENWCSTAHMVMAPHAADTRYHPSRIWDKNKDHGGLGGRDCFEFTQKQIKSLKGSNIV